MKITIIAPFSFYYIDKLVARLETYPDVEVTFIKIDHIKFEYKSYLQRIYNFGKKTFTGKNLKKQFITSTIESILEKKGKQDVILVIRPDKLEVELIEFLNRQSQKTISFYFDSLDNIPTKIKYISYFDQVFSFERKDVEKYNLDFINNFIPDENCSNNDSSYDLFNISSYDHRFPLLVKIAKKLKEAGCVYKIIVRKEKTIDCDVLEITSDYISLEEVKAYLSKSKALLDIQKENQEGLSFRVFTAMGYKKKLITSNSNIRYYDFYNPKNILIIDPTDIRIPEDFFKSDYEEVPQEVYERYTMDRWLKKVFRFNKNEK